MNQEWAAAPIRIEAMMPPVMLLFVSWQPVLAAPKKSAADSNVVMLPI